MKRLFDSRAREAQYFQGVIEQKTKGIEDLTQQSQREYARVSELAKSRQEEVRFRISSIFQAIVTLFTPEELLNIQRCIQKTPDGPAPSRGLLRAGPEVVTAAFLRPLHCLQVFCEAVTTPKDSVLFLTPKYQSLIQKATFFPEIKKFCLPLGKLGVPESTNLLRALALSFFFVLQDLKRVGRVDVPAKVSPDRLADFTTALCFPVSSWPTRFMLSGSFIHDSDDSEMEFLVIDSESDEADQEQPGP